MQCPPYPSTGLQYVDPWVLVCKLYQVPNVDAIFGADNRQFIGKGNIHVTKTIFSKFAHLSSFSICLKHIASYKSSVKSSNSSGGVCRLATHHTVVFD
jgi:hypothetical protein